eukprot:1568540-Prymnesium_polylepis.1
MAQPSSCSLVRVRAQGEGEEGVCSPFDGADGPVLELLAALAIVRGVVDVGGRHRLAHGRAEQRHVDGQLAVGPDAAADGLVVVEDGPEEDVAHLGARLPLAHVAHDRRDLVEDVLREARRADMRAGRRW